MRPFLFYTLAAVLVLCDQVSKWAIVQSLPFATTIKTPIPFLYLTHTRNTGGAFSLLQAKNHWFIIIAGVAMVALAFAYHKSARRDLWVSAALSLALGGAIGNLIDRVRYGWVIDFFDVRVWPVFNVADSAITVGILILAWTFLFKREPAEKGVQDAPDSPIVPNDSVPDHDADSTPERLNAQRPTPNAHMKPILFHLGPVPIRAYGFMVFVGFVLALFYTRAMAQRRLAGQNPESPGSITPDHVSRFCIRGLWVGIIGGRLLYVALDWKDFSRNPADLFKIWEGGMTAYGAILFGIGFLWYYCRANALSFWEFADLIAPSAALVYAVGRIGCFLNGCCYGGPWDHPWAVSFIRDGHPNLGLTPPSHPAQLYSSFMNFAIFGALHVRSLKPHCKGEVFMNYVILFLIYRTVYEAFRAGASSEILLAGLTHAQVFNLALLPFTFLFLRRLRSGTSAGPNTEVSRESLNTRTPDHLST